MGAAPDQPLRPAAVTVDISPVSGAANDCCGAGAAPQHQKVAQVASGALDDDLLP